MYNLNFKQKFQFEINQSKKMQKAFSRRIHSFLRNLRPRVTNDILQSVDEISKYEQSLHMQVVGKRRTYRKQKHKCASYRKKSKAMQMHYSHIEFKQDGSPVVNVYKNYCLSCKYLREVTISIRCNALSALLLVIPCHPNCGVLRTSVYFRYNGEGSFL